MNKKTIFLIVGIFAISSVGIYAWLTLYRVNKQNQIDKSFVMQKPAPTEKSNAPNGWKLYKNEEYGFQFNYPKNWFLSERDEFKALSYIPLTAINLYTSRFRQPDNPKLSDGEIIGAPMTIAIYDISKELSVEEWLSNSYKVDVRKLPKITLDAVIADKSIWRLREMKSLAYHYRTDSTFSFYEVGQWDNGVLKYATFVYENNHPMIYEISFALYYFGYDSMDPSDEEYADTYKKIVSSFKLAK